VLLLPGSTKESTRESLSGHEENAHTPTSPCPASGTVRALPGACLETVAMLDGSALGVFPSFLSGRSVHTSLDTDKHPENDRLSDGGKPRWYDRSKVYGRHCGSGREFSQLCLSHFEKVFD
jgi:hypothetical protein